MHYSQIIPTLKNILPEHWKITKVGAGCNIYYKIKYKLDFKNIFITYVYLYGHYSEMDVGYILEKLYYAKIIRIVCQLKRK